MVNILVVEDEKLLREAIVAALETDGYKASSAPDGKIGMQLALESQPDLIVADIMMPDIDGFRMIEELRRRPETATIPVIFITARADSQTMRTAMLLGADDFLTKPFDQQQLLAAIQTRLEKHYALAAKYTASLRILRKNILSSLPHELRTPLQQILGYAELLRMDSETASPEEVVQATDSIIRASKRLNRLMENYLAFTRLEVLVSDPIQIGMFPKHTLRDSAKVIAQLAADTAREYKREDDLDLKLSSQSLPMPAHDLRKIVGELLDNAFKFSQPESNVKVQSRLKSGDFLITVHDKGRGMTAQQVKDMGAYMQFERSLYEQQGLGLGYSIAQGLTEMYGGEIQVNSRPEQGTSVIVRFPLSTMESTYYLENDQIAGV